MIQKEFLELQKMSLPIDRGNLSTADYLNCGTYKEYIGIIQTIPSLKNHYSNISNFCNAIVKTLKLHNDGRVLDAYKTFYDAMDHIQEHLYYSFIEKTQNIHGVWEEYCRVREFKPEDEKYSVLKMLHLPFTKRELSSSGRFSAAGYPCSYMSLQDCLAWLECDRPNIFALLKISINPVAEQKYKLLRLDIRPHEYFRLDGFNNVPQEEVKEFLISLCYTLPLTAACSFICRHKNTNFKEEYVISQMLLSWIRENRADCIGVRYNTSTDNERAYFYGGHNVAIPILSPGCDGYCTELQKIFDLEHAEVNLYDTAQPEKLPPLIRLYIEENN